MYAGVPTRVDVLREGGGCVDPGGWSCRVPSTDGSFPSPYIPLTTVATVAAGFGRGLTALTAGQRRYLSVPLDLYLRSLPGLRPPPSSNPNSWTTVSSFCFEVRSRGEGVGWGRVSPQTWAFANPFVPLQFLDGLSPAPEGRRSQPRAPRTRPVSGARSRDPVDAPSPGRTIGGRG